MCVWVSRLVVGGGVEVCKVAEGDVLWLSSAMAWLTAVLSAFLVADVRFLQLQDPIAIASRLHDQYLLLSLISNTNTGL